VVVGLCGGRGTGKTQMVVEIARGLLGKKPVRYTKAVEIFISLRGAFRDGGDEESIISSWCKPDLLIVDEAHVRGETAFEDMMLTHIVDKRYDGMKDTILISNQTADEFAKSLRVSITSRMNESGGMIECQWPSYR
jgi:DNA replication protein DnaC